MKERLLTGTLGLQLLLTQVTNGKYNLDAEMLRPYFQISNDKKVCSVLVKTIRNKFKENKDIPVYHPDVKAYEVFDEDGSFLAVLYADFHPRNGKQGGALMTEFKDNGLTTRGNNSRPHVSLVMNLDKPTDEKPALFNSWRS